MARSIHSNETPLTKSSAARVAAIKNLARARYRRSEMHPPDTPADCEIMYNNPTVLYPSADMITTHGTYLLPNYSVVINLYHRLLICIACNNALSPASAYQHICTAHETLTKPPPGMVPALTEEYALPPPAFGLRVSPKPYIECGKCGRTYASKRGVTSHTCPGGLDPPRDNTTGYAQQFSVGAHNSWFLVDMEQCMHVPNIDYSSLASCLDLGVPDYNSQHVSPTLADTKKDILIARESWDKMMRKVPPKDVRELTRMSTSEDDLHKLGPHVIAYIACLQPQLRNYSTYGQQRELAENGVQQVLPTSCPTSPYKPHHLYPITPEQRAALLDLLRAFRRPGNDDDAPIDDYSDTQREMDEDEDIELLNYDELPPECVPEVPSDELLSSALDATIQGPDGGLILANSITQRIAYLTYSGRGSIMLEIERLLKENPDWNFHKVHSTLKKYHTNGYVTPLVMIFQLSTLLKIIAQTEIAPCDGRWADIQHQVIDWKGVLVRREMLCCPYNTLIQDIETNFCCNIFFGKPIPFDLSPEFFHNRDIADPSMNRAIRFCALDHPPNGFRELGHNYLHWLLSHPDLRLKFTYYANGEIHWRPTPVKRLMDAGWGLGRAQDCPRPPDRRPVLSSTPLLVSMLDKTAHKRINYRLIPSASPTLLSRYLLQLLVFIRPAQVFFARRFFGIDAAPPLPYSSLAPRPRNPHRGHVKQTSRPANTRAFRRPSTSYCLPKDAGLGAGVSPNHVHLMMLICCDWQQFIGIDRNEPLALSLHGETIDEQGPLAEHYRALVHHYLALDVPDTKAPSGTTTAPTIDVLCGQFSEELRTNFDAMRNQLIMLVGSSIREEMILQQAILQPTLPPIHSFHELRDVSNIDAIFFEKLATNKTNLFAILRCGLGKTWLTLAALPVLARGQQLIWLIPTSGLQADMVLTATKIGLKAAHYTPGEAFNTEADVVWAPIEIIAREDFQMWVKQRVNAGRVWWIVLDEIHKFLTDVGYHPIFRHLISYSVLPHGTNITLRAKRHNTHAEARAALITDINEVLPTLGNEDRIMIFCRKCDMATELAAVFNTDTYLAPRLDDPDQAELNAKLLPTWRQGVNLRGEPCKVTVSTSILWTGLNYAHVRRVYMLERPASLFDYHQQGECGGHDNEYTESTMHTSEEDSRRIPSSATDISLGVRELEELTTNDNICLCSIIYAYFERVITTCMTTTKMTSKPTAFCDYCLRLSTVIPPSDPVPIPTIETR
ncbi:hypothetical protein B0H14DRAFT_2577046 [Mycena olivaceomarginata]|nr:hypothetical protein B0H14DRAFT_2577046 [Mycena olivaceomarginata]